MVVTIHVDTNVRVGDDLHIENIMRAITAATRNANVRNELMQYTGNTLRGIEIGSRGSYTKPGFYCITVRWLVSVDLDISELIKATMILLTHAGVMDDID